MGKDVLSVLDLKDDLKTVIDNAIKMKSGEAKKGAKKPKLKKRIVMVFEKPSLRTKTSFAVAIEELGGSYVYMGPGEVQIGNRESAADAGSVLSRYFDAIIYRSFSHDMMRELADAADVPVINALDNKEHPCQVVGDLMTIADKKKKLNGLKIAYIGDGNNVCNSLILGGAITGMDIAVACPSNYGPDDGLLSEARDIAEESGSSIDVQTNPFRAAEGADVIYTDVWVSMGDEEEREQRERIFLPYKITAKIMSKAKANAMFMHCMPAHRGLEVDSEVIDGKSSVVLDQAENRLHAQKAILLLSVK